MEAHRWVRRTKISLPGNDSGRAEVCVVSFRGQKEHGAWDAHKASQVGAGTSLGSAGCRWSPGSAGCALLPSTESTAGPAGVVCGCTWPKVIVEACPPVHPTTSSLPDVMQPTSSEHLLYDTHKMSHFP